MDGYMQKARNLAAAALVTAAVYGCNDAPVEVTYQAPTNPSAYVETEEVIVSSWNTGSPEDALVQEEVIECPRSIDDCVGE